MRYTEKEIYEWITDRQAEFDTMNGRLEATYYIHIDKEGELVGDHGSAYTTVTKSVDASEWEGDDSPERFYSEFETMDNPRFREMLEDLTNEVNEMAKRWYAVLTDDEDGDWGTGSFDKAEAIAKCKSWREDVYPNAYIAIIDDGDDPVCVGEIREFDD